MMLDLFVHSCFHFEHPAFHVYTITEIAKCYKSFLHYICIYLHYFILLHYFMKILSFISSRLK